MFVDTKETAFLQDLSKPSLEALSYLLRHQELWPEGFNWDFGTCDKCAMGLACKLWAKSFRYGNDSFDGSWDSIRKDFPANVVTNVFWGADFEKDFSGDTDDLYKSITPEMVADQIDLYVKENERCM